MFTCDVTKARSFARNFVTCELLFAHIDVFYGSNGENDNVVFEVWLNRAFIKT